MKRIVSIIFIIMALAVIVIAGVSYWIFSAVSKPHEHSRTADYIKIEKGSTPREIVAKLTSEGIIVNPTATSYYLRFFGDASKLQAGEYQFESPITPLQVLKELEKGEAQTTKLVVPEGFTRFDIAKRICEKFPHIWSRENFDNSDIDCSDMVLHLIDDVSLIRDISPNAKNLEGYMYPTTYSLPRDAKPQEIIRAMVDQFRRFWKPEWTLAAYNLKRSPHEIVTIASLIETETSVESERPIVAGVINNRLAKNVPLGIDQTNVYIAKMMGRWDGTIHKSDLDVDSPYNTRKKTGLPPGPISSVTESSIRAALNPQSNDYIFYVRNVDANDGSHWFYASAAEFEKGKAKYQEWLEKERQEKQAAEANKSGTNE